MTEDQAKAVVNKVCQHVFGRASIWPLDRVKQKFAGDLSLPQEVQDATDASTTYADRANMAKDAKYISEKNVEKIDSERGFMRQTQSLTTMDDILRAWSEVNLIATERTMDAIGVALSDTVYRSENIYCSRNSFSCKNLVFCDSMDKSEFCLASARSTTTNFGIRVNDSQACSDSFEVSYSNKIISSLYIQNSFDLYECMFCAHLASKKYCVANMQFSEAEYYRLKDMVLDWIFAS